MDTLELIIRPTFESLIDEDYIEGDDDALLFEQGLDSELVSIEAGEEFVIPDGCEAVIDFLEDDAEFDDGSSFAENGEKLSAGIYLYSGGGKIQRIDFNSKHPQMKQPIDIVWDTIINSAKNRFDYDEFKAPFSILDNENAPENILFKIIIGYVGKKLNVEIAGEIQQALFPLGLCFPDGALDYFLTNKAVELKKEIRATDIALSLHAQGRKIPDILVQVNSILAQEGEG